MAVQSKNSFGEILKSSATIGGASLVNVVIGILRTKIVAMILGPGGFGLMGLYGSIASLAQTIAGMGINSSGVRQIAAAVGSGDSAKIARTVVVLRWTAVILGIAGAGTVFLFRGIISYVTFGEGRRSLAVGFLSLAVFCSLVSGAQAALIQGMRRIRDLAAIHIWGALFGMFLTILMVSLFGSDGIVPALLSAAAISIVVSWSYSRRVQIRFPQMTFTQIREEAASLLRLGTAFMASGFLMMGSGYAVRIMVLRLTDLEGAGFYQSAWNLGGLYVGFILQSMGADYYPRLTAVASDNTLCNSSANEQVRIGLLLAGPGVIATVTFAPIVIFLFYTAEFSAAVELLRWFALGMAIRVISWPLGFIIMAKGASGYFFITELAWAVVNVGLSWIFLQWFGLNGAGIAFFFSYIFHCLFVYPIVRRLSAFSWTGVNIRTGLVFLCLTASVFCGFCFLPGILATSFGIAATLGSCGYSIRILARLVPAAGVPTPLKRILERLRLMPSNAVPLNESRPAAG